MNGADQLERELSAWFDDVAAPRVPDYTSDILVATAATRQRPRWSFPARWLPGALIPGLPRSAVRPVAWRTIALLVLLGLLLAAAVSLYVGSRPRLPDPFGPAGNGLVTYAEDGDIWTVDPVTGGRALIVSGISNDTAPRFSRDGTRVAFLREITPGHHWLVVANADGSDVLPSGVSFLDADTDSLAWSPDGRWVAVVAGRYGLRTTSLVDTRNGEVRDLETPDVDVEAYWRPPDGSQLMYVRAEGDERRLFLVTIDGSLTQEIAVSAPEPHLRPGGWTPDGERFVVHHFDPDTGDAWTSLLDPETGEDEVLEIAYGRVSNDGTRLVGYQDFGGETILCVMSLPDGPCDPVAREPYLPDWEHTAGLHWSPDDRWIVALPRNASGWVLLDPEGGPPITPVWSESGVESWQRVAPSGGSWWEQILPG